MHDLLQGEMKKVMAKIEIRCLQWLGELRVGGKLRCCKAILTNNILFA